ncbi:hypothetical protein BEWA_016850 [Theileria equi strain WA]|uniref:Signal peptide-containing protein n=1 Tax=Theileria equi strain WA TaxID=1537102 RepID=L1L9B9_THEEQ|nr:hypothetical protein BEWA_016850 [Theileria equi strain WA]EKX72007.1 hypothetical protein BEWA_016850 [Theileria equi strain WA]|eukprot:XP_004831459.1 hypothetical protein BEWA_016850 [Theileria equi strain WA]
MTSIYLVISVIIVSIELLEAVDPNGAPQGSPESDHPAPSGQNPPINDSPASNDGPVEPDDEEVDDYQITMPQKGDTSDYIDKDEEGDDESFDFEGDYRNFFEVDVIPDGGEGTTRRPGQQDIFIVQGAGFSGINRRYSDNYGTDRVNQGPGIGSGRPSISFREFMGLSNSTERRKRGFSESGWLHEDIDEELEKLKGGLVNVELSDLEEYDKKLNAQVADNNRNPLINLPERAENLPRLQDQIQHLEVPERQPQNILRNAY